MPKLARKRRKRGAQRSIEVLNIQMFDDIVFEFIKVLKLKLSFKKDF